MKRKTTTATRHVRTVNYGARGRVLPVVLMIDYNDKRFYQHTSGAEDDDDDDDRQRNIH